ncbi:hypothetical protein GCM10011607_12710 [Shewanella inventionis]|uniref:Uncharacterized protein n=1 Tax=Shewanella inventionis TaxID=1738770 RepID=A0ABQ1IXF9_9GAMM|nr:hypothetical protein [Shewanella inventionis]GGB53600.1 hypothetical protein GCM10011607_12710 [Shewanella inventionis]
MKFALGIIEDGQAIGWDEMTDQDHAVKIACERSIINTKVHCIMTGESATDENGEVIFIVIGGHFYKPYDL